MALIRTTQTLFTVIYFPCLFQIVILIKEKLYSINHDCNSQVITNQILEIIAGFLCKWLGNLQVYCGESHINQIELNWIFFKSWNACSKCVVRHFFYYYSFVCFTYQNVAFRRKFKCMDASFLCFAWMESIDDYCHCDEVSTRNG